MGNSPIKSALEFVVSCVFANHKRPRNRSKSGASGMLGEVLEQQRRYPLLFG
jgi:hypothetical protein